MHFMHGWILRAVLGRSIKWSLPAARTESAPYTGYFIQMFICCQGLQSSRRRFLPQMKHGFSPREAVDGGGPHRGGIAKSREREMGCRVKAVVVARAAGDNAGRFLGWG